ncbi:MAG: hypothetical protein K0R28_3018, partial [Paenibacillus sp.]|nr:hypothetical protein [Paenibacillus sp.]
VERGTHESLLEQNGIYADMYHKQLLDEATRQQEKEWEEETKVASGGKAG